MTKITFTIQGMDCAEEAAILRRDVGPVVGGDDRLSFDVLSGRMTVADGDGWRCDAVAVVGAWKKTGMTATLISDTAPTADRDIDGHRRRVMLLTGTAGVLSALGFVAHVIVVGDLREVFREGELGTSRVPLIARLLYSVAIAAGVWTFVPKALAALRRLRPDMNLLMIVAVAGAIYLGDWLEAAMVAFLFTLSLALEAWSIGRARRAVAAMLNLTPPKVSVIGEGGQRELLAGEVTVGTKFVVRPGDRIPLDGRAHRLRWAV